MQVCTEPEALRIRLTRSHEIVYKLVTCKVVLGRSTAPGISFSALSPSAEITGEVDCRDPGIEPIVLTPGAIRHRTYPVRVNQPPFPGKSAAEPTRFLAVHAAAG